MNNGDVPAEKSASTKSPVEKLLEAMKKYDTPERAAVHAEQQWITDQLLKVLPNAQPLSPLVPSESLEEAVSREKKFLRGVLGYTIGDREAEV